MLNDILIYFTSISATQPCTFNMASSRSLCGRVSGVDPSCRSSASPEIEWVWTCFWDLLLGRFELSCPVFASGVSAIATRLEAIALRLARLQGVQAGFI